MENKEIEFQDYIIKIEEHVDIKILFFKEEEKIPENIICKKKSNKSEIIKSDIVNEREEFILSKYHSYIISLNVYNGVQ
ncbi:428_t:CDS:1, partial [Cetraspora pellucida]